MNNPLNLKELKIEFGDRLRKVRKARKMKMVDIEKSFPITRQSIYKLEKGEGSLNSFFTYLSALDEVDLFINHFFRDYTSREQSQEIMDAYKKKKSR